MVPGAINSVKKFPYGPRIRTSQLAGAAMIVSMFHRQLLLHCAAKMYEGRCSAITNVTCYYCACALALWQRVSFYQPIGGWLWNCPCICIPVPTTPRMATWAAEKCLWSLYNKVTFIKPNALCWSLIHFMHRVSARNVKHVKNGYNIFRLFAVGATCFGMCPSSVHTVCNSSQYNAFYHTSWDAWVHFCFTYTQQQDADTICRVFITSHQLYNYVILLIAVHVVICWAR